jgi:deoxyribonuclease-4
MEKKSLIGAHVSVSGGFESAIEAGERIGANCIQIFTKNNRQWQAQAIEKTTAELFKNRLKQSQIKVVVAHASYLINLGSSSHEVVEKSKLALTEELKRCDYLDILFLVLHPGTQGELSEEVALQSIAESINKALEATIHCSVLIETMAGQGKTVGYRFEQIATIIKNIEQKNRIGVCLDTCHIFAAGYSFQNEKEYEKLWQDFDLTIGQNYLKLIHLNDSKREHGSRVDRHEHIGQGKIGLKSFELIMLDKKLEDVPKILETPADNGETGDIKNIALLKDLAGNL